MQRRRQAVWAGSASVSLLKRACHATALTTAFGLATRALSDSLRAAGDSYWNAVADGWPSAV